VIAKPIQPEEKLRLAICTYLKTLTEQRDLAAVLLLEHRSLSPELHNRHIPRRDRFEQLWKDLLQSGVDEGKFKFQNVPLTTRALLGVMNWVVTWYREGGDLTIAEISNQYADMILNGIIVRDNQNDI